VRRRGWGSSVWHEGTGISGATARAAVPRILHDRRHRDAHDRQASN
jgi:hypothetical protein